LAKLAVLPLQGLEAGGYVCAQARLAPAVALGPANRLMQRLCRAADLARNRDQRSPTRRMFRLVIQNHPHRPGSHLRRELVRCPACQGSAFSRVEPPANRGGSRLTGARTSCECSSRRAEALGQIEPRRPPSEIFKSPRRRKADAQLAVAADAAGPTRQQMFNPRKLVIAQSIAPHRKPPKKKAPYEDLRDLQIPQLKTRLVSVLSLTSQGRERAKSPSVVPRRNLGRSSPAARLATWQRGIADWH
jgi:hypothetical protein